MDDKLRPRWLGTLRPRGRMRTREPKQKTKSAVDPFETCCHCGATLFGFLTYRSDATKRTVILSCGHVICPDCDFKFKSAYTASQALTQQKKNTGFHNESQFTCLKCKAFVFPIYLPNRKDLSIAICCGPGTGERCNSVCKMMTCRTCSYAFCGECLERHQKHQRHYGVMDCPPVGDPITYTRRYLVCKRHGIGSTTKCRGCGDATCFKCKDNYTDKIGQREIHHRLIPVEDTDIDLEQAMHDAHIINAELLEMSDRAKKRRVRLQDQTDLLKNEICVHFYAIMNATMARCYQQLQELQNEEIRLTTPLKTAERMCQEALRKINVSCEIDERCRSEDILCHSVAADTYRSLSQTIFKQFYEEYALAKGLMSKCDRESKLTINHISTADVLDGISKWGGTWERSVFDVSAEAPDHVIPDLELGKPWDGKTCVPDVDKTQKSLSFDTKQRAGDPLYYVSNFKNIWKSLVEKDVAPPSVPLMKLREDNRSSSGKNDVKSPSAAPTTPFVTDTRPHLEDHPSNSVSGFTPGTTAAEGSARQSSTVVKAGAVKTSTSAVSAALSSVASTAAASSRTTVNKETVLSMWANHQKQRIAEWYEHHGLRVEMPVFPRTLPSPQLQLTNLKQLWSHDEMVTILNMQNLLKSHPALSSKTSQARQLIAQLIVKNKMTLSSNQFSSPSVRPPPVNTPSTLVTSSDVATRPGSSFSTSTSAGHSPSPSARDMTDQDARSHSPAGTPGVVPPSSSRNNLEYDGTTSLKSAADQSNANADFEEQPAFVDSKVSLVSLLSTTKALQSQMASPTSEGSIAIQNKQQHVDSERINIPPLGSARTNDAVSHGGLEFSTPCSSNNNYGRFLVERRSSETPAGMSEIGRSAEKHVRVMEDTAGRIVMKIPRPMALPQPTTTSATPKTIEKGSSRSQPGGSNNITTRKRKQHSSASQSTEKKSKTLKRELDADGSHQFCWVCNDMQGVSDTHEKGVCSKCPRCYHGVCHLPKIDQDWSALPDDWCCMLCENTPVPKSKIGTLDNETIHLCYKVVLSCYDDVDAVRWFARPVKDAGYLEVIKEPSDLATVGKDLCSGKLTTVADFLTQMNRIFQNSSLFNARESRVAGAGRKIWQLYNGAVRKYLPAHSTEVWMYVTLHRDFSNVKAKRGVDGTTSLEDEQHSEKKQKLSSTNG